MCLLQQCGAAGGAGPSCPADAAARSLFRVMSKHTARVGDSKAALRASVATRQTEVRTRSRGQAVLRRLADRQRCRAVPGSGHTPAPCPACVIPAAGPARTAAGRLISCSDAASRLQAGRERSAETPSQPPPPRLPGRPLTSPAGGRGCSRTWRGCTARSSSRARRTGGTGPAAAPPPPTAAPSPAAASASPRSEQRAAGAGRERPRLRALKEPGGGGLS